MTHELTDQLRGFAAALERSAPPLTFGDIVDNPVETQVVPTRRPRPQRHRWIAAAVTVGVVGAGLLAISIDRSGRSTGPDTTPAAEQVSVPVDQPSSVPATTTTPIAATSTTTVQTTTAPTATAGAAACATCPAGVIARLVIPAIDLDLEVGADIDETSLELRPGHDPASVPIGEVGVARIWGQRTTHGAPFFDLDKLKPDDMIIVGTGTDTLVFTITDVEDGVALDAPIPTAITPTLMLAAYTPVFTDRSEIRVTAVARHVTLGERP